jgi:hypothetical protein
LGFFFFGSHSRQGFFVVSSLPATHTLSKPPTNDNPLFLRIYDVEAKYYADGEDAYDMRKPLVPGGVPPKKGGGRRPRSG